MKYAFFVILCSLSWNIWAQGSMVIVGGGPESDRAGSWSDTPYRWAVEKSRNKRVAIISTEANVSSISPFMVNYFKSLGAADAREFGIRTPNNQTYTDLMSYDVFFFRGGDQSDYYSRWKGTAVERAARDKFMQGGVLMGTSAGCAILSSVVYTAEGATMQSHHILDNTNNPAITLRDDFISIFPGYYFDTHFMERGRMPRLVGFLANWMQTQNKYPVRGIGVDDMMALCIDFKAGKGYAFGTATISIYTPSTFGTTAGRLSAGEIQVNQLVNGDTIDFVNFSVKGVSSRKQNITPALTAESLSYQLYLSGGNLLSENTALLDSLASGTQSGSLADSVLILAADTSSSSLSAQIRTQLANRNFTNVTLLRTVLSTATDTTVLLTHATRAKKIIFAGNTVAQFQTFFGATVGDSVKKLMTSAGKILAFVGEDAHFVGKKSVPTDFYSYASMAFDGNLTSVNGLGLLATSAVVSRAFSNTASSAGTYQYWENNQAAIPYLIGLDSLRFGWYLPTGSFLKVYSRSGSTYFQSFGKSSIVYINDGGAVEKISQKKENQTSRPRSGIGFDKMRLLVLNNSEILANGTGFPAVTPRAYFGVLDTANIRTGDTLVLWNASLNATSYTWAIDGKTYTEAMPKVRLDSAKTYAISLTARNSNGTDIYTTSVTVKSRTTNGIVAEFSNPDIVVYPNPSSGQINVAWANTFYEATLISTEGKTAGSYSSDMLGNLIIDKPIHKGVYLLKVTDKASGKIYFKRILAL